MQSPESNGPRASATLMLLATFALGAITGATILHLARPDGPPHRRGDGPRRAGPPGGPRIERELGLSPDQAKQFREVMEESRQRMRNEAEETRERIEAILEPEQLEKFREFRPPRPRRGRHPHPPGPRPRRP